VIKILLIENSPRDSLELLNALHEAGDAVFEVSLVARLEVALKRLSQEAVDVVLLSLYSPGAEAIEAVNRIRDQSPTVSIIVVTALDADQKAADLLRAGAQDCLSIGAVDGRLLMRAIRFAIVRKRAVDPLTLYQDQAALNTIANAVSQTLQLEEILEITITKVLEVTGCEMGHIRLRNPVNGEITLAAHRGLSPEDIDALLQHQSSTGKLAQVFSRGEVIVARASIPVVIGSEIVKGEERLIVWIPLKAKGRVVGVLNVASLRRENFSEREVELLKAIGNVIGVGLENGRLFTETRRQLGRVEALRDISVAAALSLNLSRVLKILLEKIASILPYSALAIRLLDKASGELRPVTSWNVADEDWKVAKGKPERPGLSGIVFETRRPLAIRRFLSDPRTRRPEIFRKQGLISYLGLPMIANGEAVGVLSIYTKFEHEFPDEEVRFLSALANQAGMAIHNSQLYEQLSSQAAELERSNKVKDEFLSVMSHEFRTPLNVILGYCGLMKDRSLGAISVEQEQALEKITERSKELLAMLSAILEVTRIETEAVPLLPERFDLKEFFGNFKSAHDARLAKNVVLEWRGPDANVTLNTDRRKLRLILEQLLANAIQFTESGKITIAVSRDVDDKYVNLSVLDTGVGIPTEARGLIFNKFTQLDGSTTRAHDGIGLGLYLVRKFVDLLGGEVRVESEVGVGSAFEVRLPIDADQLSMTRER
jgi:signal transduction histidine kinase/DNA-binding response OmpR family regulator